MSNENEKTWLIYGAYGYSGELIVQEAISKQRRPVVAGRNETKTRAVAEKFGLPYRVFAASGAGKNLQGIDILINCAGPFAQTAAPMMDACIEHGVHYYDISGEISVYQAAHARHELACKAGVVLCPGTGFDIVPTDTLAALLAEQLPEATHLELAFNFASLPSQGTARTAIGNIGAGGLIRKNGELTPVGLGYRISKIPFPKGTKTAVSMPWGDVFSAYHSTEIPNTLVYCAMPAALCWSQKLTNPIRGFLARPLMQRLLCSMVAKFLDAGPDENSRKIAGTEFWGKAIAANGKQVSGSMTAPSVYVMTAELSVAIALHTETLAPCGGYFTASKLLGADFLKGRNGYKVSINFAS
jgi:short subunit dehydrogenase-like uncharacterized protein